MPKIDKLTSERRNFLEQLHSLIYLEFEDQKDNKEKDEYEKIRTISINATWGMGKSLFAEALKEKIEIKNTKIFNIEVLKYNAWKNDCFNDPMKTIIGELNDQLKLSSELKEKAEIVLQNIAKKGFKTLFEIILKNFKMTEQDIQNLKEVFTGINGSSLKEYKEYKKMINDFKIALSEEAIGKTVFKPKIILVDELDRCRPDFAIEILETIKHMFDVNNIIFIFLVNKSQLKSSVSNIYGNDYGNEDYFKKFFNLELNLPELDYHEYKEIEYANLEEESYKKNENQKYKANLNNFNKNLFLNCLKNISLEISPRQRKLMLKKFELLLKTFNTIQKNNISLMTTLISYFIYSEAINNKVNLEFKDWFSQFWFNGTLNINKFWDSQEDIKDIDCSIHSFNTVIFYICSHLLKNNSEYISSNKGEADYIPHNIIQSKCMRSSIGYEDCLSCKEAHLGVCLPNNGKNGVYINRMNILNLHLGIDLNKGYEYNLYLPLESKYFQEYSYAEVLLQWCKDKCTFVSSME